MSEVVEDGECGELQRHRHHRTRISEGYVTDDGMAIQGQGTEKESRILLVRECL